VECQEPLCSRLIENCSKGVRELSVRLNGHTGGQIGEGNEDHVMDRIFVHKRIVSVVRRIEFVNDRIPYII
jgi:hypothetical protein